MGKLHTNSPIIFLLNSLKYYNFSEWYVCRICKRLIPSKNSMYVCGRDKITHFNRELSEENETYHFFIKININHE